MTLRSIHTATPVVIPCGAVHIAADLRVPVTPRGVVLFVHGSGSSRHSARNQSVADFLVRRGFATLLIDLLTLDEEAVDRHTAHLRFDIPMLGKRVIAAIDWLAGSNVRSLPVGLFGASTGAAAALIAAAARPRQVAAVVSRGGRPDLAADALAHVTAPTLLLVGELDDVVIGLNRRAAESLRAAKVSLEIVPGASHLFEEPGTLEAVSEAAAQWFDRYAATSPPAPTV